MSEQKQTVYLGNGKAVANGKGVKIRIYLDKLPKEKIKTDDKGRKFINVVTWENKEPDKYGFTHSMQLDEWEKPEEAAASAPQTVQATPVGSQDDLPF